MSERFDDTRDRAVNDYVDGRLDDRERTAFEARMKRDPELTAEVAALRSVIDAARALPDELPPSRDLWPDLRSRLTPRDTARDRSARWWMSRIAAPVAVAAAALLAVALLSDRPAGTDDTGIADADPKPRTEPDAATTIERAVFDDTEPAWRSAVWALERECRGAGREMLASWRATGAETDPGTLDAIDASLTVLDRAIAETRDALEANPDNRELAAMLATRYHQKLALIHEATRLARIA